MNQGSFGRPFKFAQRVVSPINRPQSQSGLVLFLLLTACFFVEPALNAQPAIDPAPSMASTNPVPKSPAEQLAALELERTNAWQRVLQIVNQPVRAYARTPNYPVSIYSPGWFHEGASRPDFNTVDVRQSQELIYDKYQYVSSDLNPNMMFLGRDLEFNAMTKYFYTDRSRPKHKLTEAQMIEINQLYRTIGRCEHEIRRLQPPLATETVQSSDAESEAGSAESGQPLAGIRSLSQKTRMLYGGIAIGVLILAVLASRIFRSKAD
jgi:hypothetical protein